MNLLGLFFGALFGFILSQSRITDYATMSEMFQLKGIHVMGVMGAAIGVAAAGFYLLRKSGANAVVGGCGVERPTGAIEKGVVLGGLIFGTGWALTGT